MVVLSLRAYLDGGGDLAALPLLDSLAHSIVVARRRRSPEWLQETAATSRRLAASLLDDPQTHQLATLLLWEAEAYEDEEVARRFERALPAELLAELLVVAEEERHPHRLLVTALERFTCAACGDSYAEATAVVVDDSDGLTYCGACLALAAAALSGIDAVDGSELGPLPGAGPRPRPRHQRGRLQQVGAAAAGLLLGAGMLTSAGALPAGLQYVAHDGLAHVGVHVPEGPPRAVAGQPCDPTGTPTGGACPAPEGARAVSRGQDGGTGGRARDRIADARGQHGPRGTSASADDLTITSDVLEPEPAHGPGSAEPDRVPADAGPVAGPGDGPAPPAPPAVRDDAEDRAPAGGDGDVARPGRAGTTDPDDDEGGDDEGPGDEGDRSDVQHGTPGADGDGPKANGAGPDDARPPRGGTEPSPAGRGGGDGSRPAADGRDPAPHDGASPTPAPPATEPGGQQGPGASGPASAPAEPGQGQGADGQPAPAPATPEPGQEQGSGDQGADGSQPATPEPGQEQGSGDQPAPAPATPEPGQEQASGGQPATPESGQEQGSGDQGAPAGQPSDGGGAGRAQP